jgi:hypothetical protein
MKHSQIQKLIKLLGGDSGTAFSMFPTTSQDNHPALVLAEECGNEIVLYGVANALMIIQKELNNLIAMLQEGALGAEPDVTVPAELSLENVQELASLAEDLDLTGDPDLMKKAELIDEILLTIGADKAEVTARKSAQDSEIDKIKARYEAHESHDRVKKEHDEQNQVAEATKAIADKVKEFRPLEAPLKTRSCPDHPGAQMARIGDDTYQCALDKKIYNYQVGYTTLKGNKVPGGDISNQTQALHDRPNESTSFDSRESRLNQS